MTTNVTTRSKGLEEHSSKVATNKQQGVKPLANRDPNQPAKLTVKDANKNLALPKILAPKKVPPRSHFVTRKSQPTFTIYCDPKPPDKKLLFVEKNVDKISSSEETTNKENVLPPEEKSFEELKNIDHNASVLDQSISSVGSVGITNADDPEDESIYGSAVDELSVSEYLTARPFSERERIEHIWLYHSVYAEDIYQYMRQRELRLCPKAHYLMKQTDITADMRMILVDWLADVAVEYNLAQDTLHLTVSIIDRTLSVIDCPRLKLQLIGATAVMIASKFEEIYPPELKEYVYITDDTYTANQILRMEKVILDTLNYDLCAPTSQWFATRIAHKARCTKKTSCCMDYLLELALLDAWYLKCRSSVLAASALCLANVLTGPVPWPTELEEDTGIGIDEMSVILPHLLQSFRKAPDSPHKAVYDKYSSSKYCSVAQLKAPLELPTAS
ncbi:hypothetical protein AB6A40_004901 [Gnathostoma spinigerum]|uniref:Cyclin N-terminal domain-containing protein n=1 Tax=Gnathostoma spinigerum TaxID=75299 RepID=A0ABD6EG30_9BILA